MKLLIAADAAPPRFEGIQLLHAARAGGIEAALFDHPASRDPGIDLPVAVRACGADLVLLVAPAREDPATLDVVRALGARVVAWFGPEPERAPAWLRARRRWIAGGADAVFATDAHAARALQDRHGAAAALLEPSFAADTLGTGVAAASHGAEAASRGAEAAPRGGAFVSVRGADDALRVGGPVARADVEGYGDVAAFPARVHRAALAAPADFGRIVAGRRYLCHARTGSPPPGVFDDASAAAAAGARVFTLVPGEPLGAARALKPDQDLGFAERIGRVMHRMQMVGSGSR